MTAPTGSRRAVFLDRDGSLIEDSGYPRDPDRVHLLPGVAETLRELEHRGFLLILVSNQSGIGRGLVTPAEAAAVHARLVELLARAGARLHAAYYCPHTPDEGCLCRKPAPGMLLQAAKEWDIDLSRSFFVGDKPSDIEAGKATGCFTILLASDRSAPCDPPPDRMAEHFRQVLDWLLGKEQ
jgi:D-glycero-D-manno-heptose 1,7-bisphosphate phosphatase